MSCSYYTFRQGDYYCTKKGDYVSSDTYYSYCKGYYYDDCPIYKHEESSGCFLTTIVCDSIGLQDNNPVLNTLRAFRNNILQQNPIYYDILKYYDSIGPVIAKKISEDKEKSKLSKYLYSSILIPICNYISINNYEEAITKYEAMTLSLINYYGLKKQYNSIEFKNDFIPEKSGHGRILKK